MAASDELDVVNETSLERTREREIREKDEEIASLRAQIESMQSPPNVLPSDKPGRMYQVFGSGFAYAFTFHGSRTVKRGDRIKLTREEAKALTSSPVLVTPLPESEGGPSATELTATAA